MSVSRFEISAFCAQGGISESVYDLWFDLVARCWRENRTKPHEWGVLGTFGDMLVEGANDPGPGKRTDLRLVQPE